MILKDLGDYIRDRGIVSLHETALHFGSEPSAVEAMADRWVQKGRVEKILMEAGKCGGCTMCPPGVKIHYRWVMPEGQQPIQFMCSKK